MGTAITNWGKPYYKLGQLLQVGAIITNWDITVGFHFCPPPLPFEQHVGFIHENYALKIFVLLHSCFECNKQRKEKQQQLFQDS